jgi:hypothetical protein
MTNHGTESLESWFKNRPPEFSIFVDIFTELGYSSFSDFSFFSEMEKETAHTLFRVTFIEAPFGPVGEFINSSFSELKLVTFGT